MKYLIDGYNVIHQITALKGKRLRNQREGLIRLLETAQAQNKQLKDLTVVFDGKTEVSAPQMNSSVKVIFSRDGCADKKIKEILERSSFTRDICVVSDDREVRFYVGSGGAKKISVQQFLKKVVSTSPRQHDFKLDEHEARRINQELEKIWLKNTDCTDEKSRLHG